MSETDVHEGLDGWLFLVGGSNNVVVQAKKTIEMDVQIAAWKRIFEARYKACRQAGCQYLTMIAPEKIYVYDDKLGSLSLNPKLSLRRRLHKGLLFRPRLRRSYIDLSPQFRAHRSRQDLYQRTDTHWTLAGCEIAYRQICRSCRATPIEDFSKRPHREERSSGDLGSKLDPKKLELRTVYDLQLNAKRVHANSQALMFEAGQISSHRGIHHVYRNDSDHADPRTLLLIGDSYCNYPAGSLVVMLAETFREVHFIWSPAVDWAYFSRLKPDLMVFEMAERFLCQVTADTYSVLP